MYMYFVPKNATWLSPRIQVYLQLPASLYSLWKYEFHNEYLAELLERITEIDVKIVENPI